jgi:trk system potassium uptake protein TrkH
MQLFKAEVAGPTKDKLTPRIAETARLLWGVYVLLTLAEIILLVIGEMPAFDAVCHAFGTIATGGFSVKNASIGYYNSAYIDAVVTIFMFASATNFSLHYAALRGSPRVYFRNDELKFFAASFVVGCAIVTVAIAGPSFGGDLANAFRFAAFNVVSIMTCTGFATADFALWVPVAQLVLLWLLFPGGCAGSTSGGMKNIRVLLLLRSAMNELKKLVHPKLVTTVRNDGRAVEPEILSAITGFVILYVATFSTSSLILTATGLDIVTSVSAVASCMANCGPGLGTVGPVANYSQLSVLAKWVLDACMILGRLEIYSVFVVFSSMFWRR